MAYKLQIVYKIAVFVDVSRNILCYHDQEVSNLKVKIEKAEFARKIWYLLW